MCALVTVRKSVDPWRLKRALLESGASAEWMVLQKAFYILDSYLTECRGRAGGFGPGLVSFELGDDGFFPVVSSYWV